MLYGDFPLDFDPLAGVRRTIERLHRARADQELRVLLTRRIGDKALDTAQRKTVWLRDGIVICVGGERQKESVSMYFGVSILIQSYFWLLFGATKRAMKKMALSGIIHWAQLTDVILLNVLDEIHQRAELHSTLIELTNIKKEYSHNLFIFKYYPRSEREKLIGFDVDFLALRIICVKC